MSQLKAFLSYSSENDELAGSYKKHLEKYYGFKVFVAHDDNIPSLDWASEIRDQISTSDIFIILVSSDSEKSTLVNQEIGMALAFKIRIFPIKIDETNPFGFIDKIHGFAYIPDPDIGILKNGTILFSILTSKRDEFKILGELAIESAIYALSRSGQFKDSNIIIKTLLEAEIQRGFNDKQVQLLKDVCCNNFEVHGGAFEYNPLKTLLEKKYHVIELP